MSQFHFLSVVTYLKLILNFSSLQLHQLLLSLLMFSYVSNSMFVVIPSRRTCCEIEFLPGWMPNNEFMCNSSRKYCNVSSIIRCSLNFQFRSRIWFETSFWLNLVFYFSILLPKVIKIWIFCSSFFSLNFKFYFFKRNQVIADIFWAKKSSSI